MFEVEVRNVAGEATAVGSLAELVDRVDDIAEIPNSLRRGTEILLGDVRIGGTAS